MWWPRLKSLHCNSTEITMNIQTFVLFMSNANKNNTACIYKCHPGFTYYYNSITVTYMYIKHVSNKAFLKTITGMNKLHDCTCIVYSHTLYKYSMKCK